MKLTSLVLSKAEREKAVEASTPPEDAPRYPWGMSLTLDDEVLEKLGIDTLPALGTELELVAKVKVTRVSASDDADGGKYRSLSLQLTDACLEGYGDAKKKSAESALYEK